MAENLPDFEGVDDIDGCWLLEYMDEELLRVDKRATRLQNETWLRTAQNKWKIREILCMLSSQTLSIWVGQWWKQAFEVDELWRCAFALKNPILACFSAATNFQNSCTCQSHAHSQTQGYGLGCSTPWIQYVRQQLSLSDSTLLSQLSDQSWSHSSNAPCTLCSPGWNTVLITGVKV